MLYGLAKRIIDLSLASLLLLLFGWAYLVVWILVWFDSPGPVIFKQVRLGLNGVPFTLYKFRTMQVGTENTGTHEVSPDRITRFGHFLRRSKIDELPQAWNVLRNEMSFVGPRPCLPQQTEIVELRNLHRVFQVLPGLTGLAQINRVDMSDPEALTLCDKKYSLERSTLLDLKILALTALHIRQPGSLDGQYSL